MNVQLDPKEIEAIQKALENPKYEWRTMAGVATDSAVPVDRVAAYLLGNSEDVVRSSVPSKDGEELFTTRRHFTANASPIQRISSAFKNRKA